MSDPNEDPLHKLAPSIVEIISDKDSTTLGTGFVVTDDGLVVTCRHVITDPQNNLMNSVRVRFHSDSKTETKKFTAGRLKKKEGLKDVPSIDIAFLKLDSLPEKGVSPVRLDDKVVSLNHFASIGFKKAEEFTGLSAKGEIRILTYIKNSEGSIISPEVIELYSPNQIEPGMSGAPVLDIERGRVIGIILERYIEQYNPAASNMAFALPVKSMIELCPSLREKNPGLTVLSKFLRAIGEEVETSIYKWIDEVYEPPIEYEDIKESLKSKRIVFITGTKEFGKTFTAVKLMYDYFREGNLNSGYKPRWIRAGKQSGREGADPRELMKLENEDYLKPDEIMYFEDPFGKTEYERSSDLEDRIGSIIDSINNVQDAYVIITSREEVFKEFQREYNSSIRLASFEKKLNLKRASYGIEERKEMLLRWAKINNCKWLLDSALTDHVLNTVNSRWLLPTPLNIRDFVKASRNVLDGNRLEDIIKEKSQETSIRFANEIMEIEEDEKILFLSFAYIGDRKLDLDFVKKQYDTLTTAWKGSSQKDYKDFKRVREWFENDKINISEHKIAFSHPSYFEAFQHAISSEKQGSDRVRNVFVQALLTLANEKEAASSIAGVITYNFDNLPPTAQQLLFKLADNDEAFTAVAYGVADNFDNLPPTAQQLLFKLADKAGWEGAESVSLAIAYGSFDKLPPNVREELILKLASKLKEKIEHTEDQLLEFKRSRLGTALASAIIRNFDKLPSNIQQLLFKLADNDNTANAVPIALGLAGFDKLPPNVREELILTLAENDRAVGVARTITNNFDKLPSNIQQLLFKLADNDNTAPHVPDAIEFSFDKLPPNVREQLLLKLSENDKASQGVAYALVRNFDKLPSNIQQLLFVLLDKGKYNVGVVYAIADNFNNLPPHIQQLLFDFAYEPGWEGTFYASNAIEFSFDKLPPNVREQLLLKLADNALKLAGDDKDRRSVAAARAAARTVASAITRNYDKLPPNVQQVLFELADKQSVREEVSSAIRNYCNIISEHVGREILAKLEEKGIA